MAATGEILMAAVTTRELVERDPIPIRRTTVG
jgi:hypothetical protein